MKSPGLLSLLFFISFLSSFSAFPVQITPSGILSSSQHPNCTLLPAVVIPTFEPTDNDYANDFSKLMKPLESCWKVASSKEPYPICADVYEVLYNLSSCSTNGFVRLKSKVVVETHSDVCLGFTETEARNVNPYLRNRLICNMLCSEKYVPVCRVLLWAYELQNKLEVASKSVVEESKSSVMEYEDFHQYWEENKCVFVDSELSGQLYDGRSFLDNYLEGCHNTIANQEASALCEELFHMLIWLSSCNPQFHQTGNRVVKEISPDVCTGFANIDAALLGGETDISLYLRNDTVCEAVCTEKLLKVCQLLLWTYEVKHSLETEPDAAPAGSVSKENTGDEDGNHPASSKLDMPAKLQSNTAKSQSEQPKQDSSENFGGSPVDSDAEHNSYGEPLLEDKPEASNLPKEPVSHLNKEDDEAKDEHTVETSGVKGAGISKNSTQTDKHQKTTDVNLAAEQHKTYHSNFLNTASHKTAGSTGSASFSGSVQSVPPNNTASVKTQDSNSMVKSSEFGSLDLNDKKYDVKSDHQSQDENERKPSQEHVSESDAVLAEHNVPNEAAERSSSASAASTSTTSMTTSSVFLPSEVFESKGKSVIGMENSDTADNFKPSKDIQDFDGSSLYDMSPETSDQKNLETSQFKNFDKSSQDDFIKEDSSNFFLYFLCIVALVAGCYLVVHNKQKVIALIVEGRHERRRRPHGASYKKLDTK